MSLSASRGIAAPIRRGMTRRRELLSGSDRAGSALALARSAVDLQLAPCGVTSGPDAVACGHATAANSTGIDAGSALSNDREQLFDNGGASTPAASSRSAVNIGATVTGFGSANANTTGSDVIVVNGGSVTLTPSGRLDALAARRRAVCTVPANLRLDLRLRGVGDSVSVPEYPFRHASTLTHENTAYIREYP
jgi:Tfp pilus assembly protein FimT